MAGTHPHYEDISDWFGIKGGRHWMIPSLDQIQNYCLAQRLPPLTSIVVQKGSEKPGARYIIRFGSVENDWERTHTHDWSREDTPTPEALAAVRTRRGVRKPTPDLPPASTEGSALMRYRIGMDLFRKAVLQNFDHACCICGIAEKGLLDAAHIKGWARDPERRLRVENGLAMCVLHHRALDRELLKVEADGSVKVAKDALGGKGFYGQAIAAFDGRAIAKSRAPVEL